MTDVPRELYELAQLNGIELGYCDLNGQYCTAPPETLLSILRSLDVPIDQAHQARDLLRESRLASARLLIEPVIVAWQGTANFYWLRVAAEEAGGSVECRLVEESGSTRSWTVPHEDFVERHERECEGYRYIENRVRLPEGLPIGYHRLEISVGAQTVAAMLISAPGTAYVAEGAAKRSWGVFLPLYALHRRESWGAGDFGDLESLNEWVADHGGGLVATLPLLASFYDLPGDESPYRPASRLFWNEFFVDVARIPEAQGCSQLQTLMAMTEVCGTQASLRENRLVDYGGQMALKRQMLEILAKQFFAGDSPRRRNLQELIGRVPDLDRYARFRGAGVKQGRDWSVWPDRMRDGDLQAGDFDEETYRYHLYVQMVVAEQLAHLSEGARQRQLTWYLDLPLGVHPQGFDVWRYPDAFAQRVSGGAPPDGFFTGGQVWGFLPLHPQRLRRQGYGYFLSVLRAHLSYAKLLRIDHVMGLHRLFWIPSGSAARDGAYVRYAADELYAVLTIESQRHCARVIGEDLGTVPPETRVAMDRHQVGRLFVVQYECRADEHHALSDPGPNSVASLNTHDMPPFASYWRGLDIDDRVDLGLIREEEARGQREHRAHTRHAVIQFLRHRGLLTEDDTMEAVLEACLVYLGQSHAEVVLVNLEDLWGETLPQNTPGTVDERVNWRRKTRLTLEEITSDPLIDKIVRSVAASRKWSPEGL